jgi:hypothetical protein
MEMVMAYRNEPLVSYHRTSITVGAKRKRPHDSTKIAVRVVIATRNQATLMGDADPWKAATVEDATGPLPPPRVPFPLAMGVMTAVPVPV